MLRGRYIQEEGCTACVIGAMLLGEYETEKAARTFVNFPHYGPGAWVDAVMRRWPWTAEVVTCPSRPCRIRVWPIARIAEHLFEHHLWTREAVEAWLRTLEPASERGEPIVDEVRALVEGVGVKVPA